ncbi:MAG: ATPase [Chloroflexi bacterium]|nr:ATPase [Chloroflexota bacterium]
MDIQFLIDRLEKLVQDSAKIPLANLRLVDEEAVLQAIDQLRTAIPEEIRVARQIQQQRERVLAQGKEEANRVVEIARQQAAEMVDTHEVLRAAEVRAQTIVERAKREADEIRQGADGYAEQILTFLDDRLSQAHHQIRSGLVELGRAQPGSDTSDTGDLDDGTMRPDTTASQTPKARGDARSAN